MNPIDQVASHLPMSGIDFGYCPVKIPTTKGLSLFNPTQSTIRYNLTTMDPLFTVNVFTGKFLFMPLKFEPKPKVIISQNNAISVTILLT